MDIEQRTDEWFEIRLGKATASRFKDILAMTKAGAEGAARRNYRAQLVVERLTGRTPDRFRNKAMEWGAETEELAQLTYTLQTGNTVEPVGFIEHDKLQAGASPDGQIGKNGGLEIKCYNTANHIEALKSGHMPKEHLPQVQGQMWICEYDWVDFVSFDPDMPENAQFFLDRIHRDDAYIEMLEGSVAMFLQEVIDEAEFIKTYSRKVKEAV